MESLLLVDDERSLREGLRAMLTGEGFSVTAVRGGAEALKAYRDSPFDLVLLDVMMPKMNGFRVLEEIRRIDASVPVVFLTARDSEADEVRGLGLGADDYISKSASEAVLVARIRAHLDRSARSGPESGDTVRIGPLRVDLRRLEVEGEGGYSARLTKTEADILRILAGGRGCVFSADELISALRGEGFACEDGMLYSHISNLRRKLSPAGECICNDRKAGYRLLK